jgi:hypothetical protein
MAETETETETTTPSQPKPKPKTKTKTKRKTARERAAINRQNSRQSTGPKTDKGKRISSMNSTRHAFCTETRALPGEDAVLLRETTARFFDIYRPTTPGEAACVDDMAWARVQVTRVRRSIQAILVRQCDAAALDYDLGQETEVQRLIDTLRHSPAAALHQLRQSAAGCRWLIGRWERLGTALHQQGGWTTAERDEAIRLQGTTPTPDSVDAARTCRYADWVKIDSPLEVIEPIDLRIVVETMDDPRVIEALANRPSKETCLEWLGRLVAEHLEELRGREARLRPLEEQGRAAAVARAQVLGAADAVLLRYERQYELMFHRAYAALLKGR